MWRGQQREGEADEGLGELAGDGAGDATGTRAQQPLERPRAPLSGSSGGSGHDPVAWSSVSRHSRITNRRAPYGRSRSEVVRPTGVRLRRMPTPTFLVVGTARAGTTAVVEGLRTHPDVFITHPKEPHYFAFHGTVPDFQGPGDDESINRIAITDRDRYLALYNNTGDTLAGATARCPRCCCSPRTPHPRSHGSRPGGDARAGRGAARAGGAGLLQLHLPPAPGRRDRGGLPRRPRREPRADRRPLAPHVALHRAEPLRQRPATAGVDTEWAGSGSGCGSTTSWTTTTTRC